MSDVGSDVRSPGVHSVFFFFFFLAGWIFYFYEFYFIILDFILFIGLYFTYCIFSFAFGYVYKRDIENT